MPYCKIIGDKVDNIVECDNIFAEENGLVWIDPPVGVDWILIDGVWRDCTEAEKRVELLTDAQRRIDQLNELYVNHPTNWNALTQAKRDEIISLIAKLENIENVEGFPWIMLPDRFEAEYKPGEEW